MKKAIAITLVALFLGLAGCASQVPIPTTYEKSYQPKMWAAHHWNVLAADVAERLAGVLAADGQSRVVYVEKPNPSSVFSGAFHDLFITQLMNKGFGVTRSAGASQLTIVYDVTYAGDADLEVQSGYTEVEQPDDDVIINVSVISGNRYVTRISEIFYVDHKIRGELYAPRSPGPTRLVEVVGS